MLKIYFPIDHKIFTSCWLLAVFRLHHILSYFQNKKYAFRTQIKGAVKLVHSHIFSDILLMRGLLRHNAFTSTIWKKSHSSPLTRHLAPTRKLVFDGFASSAPISPPWWPTSLHTSVRVVRPGFLRGQETVKRRGALKGKEVSSTWVAPFKISLL